MFLGVTLTMGFYEGRRLVRNTAKAWTAAQSQVSGKDANTNTRRKALIKALEDEKGAEHVAQLRENRQAPNHPSNAQQPARQLTPAQNRGAKNVMRGRGKGAYKELSDEQRDVIRDRRKRRRERLRDQHGSANPNKREGANGAQPDDGVEEGFEGRGDEPPLEDTAAL